MNKIKEILKRPQLRYGTYSTVITAVVIGIVIVINMIASQFSDTIGSIDLSDNKIYEITDTSKTFLKELDKEVTIRVFAEESSMDERIKTFVKKYAALSNKITVEWIDPVLHPALAEEYGGESESIIVSCEDTGKQETVYFTEIITYDYSSYYYSGYATESEFDGEGQLTSAINAVTNDVTKKVYRTAGHGESTFSTTINDLFGKSNFSVSELNTLMQNEIPEDCDLLLCYAPTTDFTEDEKNMISEYIQSGGDVFLILSASQSETPNLDALLLEYGMQKAAGYIADVERCYQGNYYYIFPELSLSGDMAAGMSSEMVLVAESLGVTETEPARDTISLSAFMETSSSAYAVDEENAVAGTYVLGAVATEDEGQFTVITAEYLINSSITDTFTTLENLTLFMNAVTNHFDDVENISIAAKSLTITYNTVQHAGAFGIFFIFGIPLLIVGYGFIKWLKRRKA